jgi:hypothetical protein
VALTAAQVGRILGFKGKLRPGVPKELPDPTEQRLEIDAIIFPPKAPPKR